MLGGEEPQYLQARRDRDDLGRRARADGRHVDEVVGTLSEETVERLRSSLARQCLVRWQTDYVASRRPGAPTRYRAAMSSGTPMGRRSRSAAHRRQHCAAAGAAGEGGSRVRWATAWAV